MGSSLAIIGDGALLRGGLGDAVRRWGFRLADAEDEEEGTRFAYLIDGTDRSIRRDPKGLAAAVAKAQMLRERDGSRLVPIGLLLPPGDAVTADLESVDGLMTPPVSSSQFANRLRLMRRDRMMALERIVRGRLYPADAEPPRPRRSTPCIMIVGRGRSYGRLSAALHAAGLDPAASLVGALSLDNALSYLDAMAFDGIVIDADGPEALFSVLSLRGHPDHAALPIYAVSEETTREAQQALFDAGLTDRLDLERPEDAGGAIRVSALEAMGRRWIAAALTAAASHACRDSDHGDPATGLANESCFYRYLSDWTATVGRADRIIMMTIEARSVTPGLQLDRDVLRQVATLLRRLTRAETLLAHLGGGTFTTVFLGGAHEAEALARRLRSVVRATRFNDATGLMPLSLDLAVRLSSAGSATGPEGAISSPVTHRAPGAG